MKKLIALLSLAVALCASAAYADNPSALSQTTDDGITTIITTGRAQADITLNSDGSLTFTVYPAVTRTSPSGKVIGQAKQLDTSDSFPATMSPSMVAQFLEIVKVGHAAHEAKKAAAREAAANPPAPNP